MDTPRITRIINELEKQKKELSETSRNAKSGDEVIAFAASATAVDAVLKALRA